MSPLPVFQVVYAHRYPHANSGRNVDSRINLSGHTDAYTKPDAITYYRLDATPPPVPACEPYPNARTPFQRPLTLVNRWSTIELTTNGNQQRATITNTWSRRDFLV